MITVPCHGCEEPIDAERAAIDEHLHPYCAQCAELRAALAQTCADCGSAVDRGIKSSHDRLFCVPCGIKRLIAERDSLIEAVLIWRRLYYGMAIAAAIGLLMQFAHYWEAHR